MVSLKNDRRSRPKNVLQTPRMNTPIKPWSNHRQVLWALGVFSLIFLALALGLIFLIQGGFGPGSKPAAPRFPEFFGAILLAIPCVYYIVVAHRAWSRKLWVVGIVIHLFLLVFLLFTLVASHGASLIVLPFLLVGPVTWYLHAK